MTDDAPLILFGAFDRHNFGDLLLGEIAAAETDRKVLFAGLAARDMRKSGGRQVHRLGDLLAEWPRRCGGAPELLHVGGEILTTTAWEAAVMLCDDARVADVIRRYDHNASARDRWAAARLQTIRRLPYVIDKAALPQGSRVSFRAVGGTGFVRLPKAIREEARTALANSTSASVRDRLTQAALVAEGLMLPLEADSAVRIATRFGATVAAAMAHEAFVALRHEFPSGWIALQFAAEHADDATLRALAVELDALGMPIVAFRAGAAPWHDSIDAYARLGRALRQPMRIFHALGIWQICAVIAASDALLATSLHASLVARAYGRPLIRSHALQAPEKVEAALAVAFPAT